MELYKIKEMVELYSNVKIDPKTRKQHMVFLRSIYFKLCRDFTDYSLSVIGKSINKDHATVLHSLKIVDMVLKKKEYKKIYDKCESNISNFSEGLEKEELIEKYENKISSLEEQLEIVNRNINNEVVKKIIGMSENNLRLFEETRLNPFLKMNKQYA